MNNKISAIIVIKDFPAHIFETLNSIDDLVSEIIIGDIGISEDLKTKLEDNKKIRIFKCPQSTPFADLIKEDLKKNAKYEYILYVDPDEIFPNTFKEIIKNNLGKYDYFQFPRKNIIFGKWIRYTRWWPDYQMRIVDKNKIIWPRNIHMQPTASDNGYRFEPDEKYAIIHYNYDSIDQYIGKATRYAKYEARHLVKTNKSLTLSDTLKKSRSEFISRFFTFDGYKDGTHGFVLSLLQMFYYFLVFFYYWEEKKYFVMNQEELIKAPKQFFSRSLFETNFWLVNKKLFSLGRRIKVKIENLILNSFKI